MRVQAIRIGVVIHRDLVDLIMAKEDQRRLNRLGRVQWTKSRRPITTAEAVKILKDCRIGIGSWESPHPDAPLMSACPDLRLWVHAAGTVKHMFGPHLEGRNLVIATCKPANGENVAHMALAEIILGLRGALQNADANRRGIAAWPPRVRTLHGATIGIVGASLIGRRMIELLRPFRCRVLVYDPFLPAFAARKLGAEKESSLVRLCRRSDAVSLHTPDLPATRHLMGAKEFRAMRDDAVFINTARGACVDERALIAELRKGRLFAMLDVTWPEPPARNSPLRRLPNVRYTSHIAGPPSFTFGRQAVDDVERWLSGKPPLNVARPEDLDRSA